MMKKLKMGIGTKLVLQVTSILLVLLVVSFALIITITAKNNQTSANSQVTSMLAHSMQGYQDLDASQRRTTYNSMLKSVLAEHPEYIGIWTCWDNLRN
jgi:ABC-type transport system involved in cytochrome bd biosynthesis fused ATPase/permease subunit